MSILSIIQKIEDRLHITAISQDVGRLYHFLTELTHEIPDDLSVSNALSDLEATDLEAAAVLSHVHFTRHGAPASLEEAQAKAVGTPADAPPVAAEAVAEATGQLSESDLTPAQVADLHAQDEASGADAVMVARSYLPSEVAAANAARDAEYDVAKAEIETVAALVAENPAPISAQAAEIPVVDISATLATAVAEPAGFDPGLPTPSQSM